MKVFIALARDAFGNPPIIAIKVYNGLILLAFAIAMKWQSLEGVYEVFRLEGLVDGFIMPSWPYAIITGITALGSLTTRPSTFFSRYALFGSSLIYISLATAFGLTGASTGMTTYGLMGAFTFYASLKTPNGKRLWT